MTRWALAVGLCAVCLVLGACAARSINLPTDPGSQLPDFEDIYRSATSACAGVRTMTTELSLSGTAGGRRLRGRAIAGFERPGSMRLEGVAPFGPPAFILAASGDTATLLLPRDNRVVRGARGEQILGALTGIELGPSDLQAILTGCVTATPGAMGGRLHRNGWASIDLANGATMFLERLGTGWQPRAARRPGWQVEYPAWQSGFPRAVRLSSLDPGVDVALTASVSQIEVNVDLDPSAFAVRVPAGAREMTVGELRDAGPLGQ